MHASTCSTRERWRRPCARLARRSNWSDIPNEGHGLAIDFDRDDFYARLLAFLKDNTY